MPASERRLHQRKIPGATIYVAFSYNNGGIISDISSTGLGFCAASPVPNSGIINFSFPRTPDSRVDATGEMVWRDKTRKKGGLRFTLLPWEAYELLGISRPSAPQIDERVERLKAQAGLEIARRMSPELYPSASEPQCPKCGGIDVRKSHRSGILERSLSRILKVRPYRCLYCYRRFFRTD